MHSLACTYSLPEQHFDSVLPAMPNHSLGNFLLPWHCVVQKSFFGQETGGKIFFFEIVLQSIMFVIYEYEYIKAKTTYDMKIIHVDIQVFGFACCLIPWKSLSGLRYVYPFKMYKVREVFGTNQKLVAAFEWALCCHIQQIQLYEWAKVAFTGAPVCWSHTLLKNLLKLSLLWNVFTF